MGPNLPNELGQKPVPGVKPNAHMEHEAHCGCVLVIGFCEHLGDTRSNICNVMEQGNYTSAVPSVEYVTPAKKVQSYDVVKAHLYKVIFASGEEVGQKTSHVVTHCH